MSGITETTSEGWKAKDSNSWVTVKFGFHRGIEVVEPFLPAMGLKMPNKDSESMSLNLGAQD